MRPALVLVHGTRMNRRQWEPYAALLPGVALHTLDLPGHGERVGEEFTREAALSVLGAAVQEATPRTTDGAPVRPVLAGHSLGGYLAATWAHEHPEDLAALVLLGASADPAGPLTGLYQGFARVLPHLGPDRMARGMNAVMRGLGARGERAALLPDGAAYAALPAAWRLVIDECGPHQLAGLGCPVVLANGQLDQMRLHVGRYAAAARDPHVVTIPRATHLMPVTHPEAVARVLRLGLDLATAKDQG